MTILMTEEQGRAIGKIARDGFNGNLLIEQENESLRVTYATYDGVLETALIAPDGTVT